MRQVKYNIYTEDVNRENILHIINKFFTGYNLQVLTGYWKGVKEKSLKIEVIGLPWDYSGIEKIAKDIKKLNKQEAVYITQEKIEAYLI